MCKKQQLQAPKPLPFQPSTDISSIRPSAFTSLWICWGEPKSFTKAKSYELCFGGEFVVFHFESHKPFPSCWKKLVDGFQNLRSNVVQVLKCYGVMIFVLPSNDTRWVATGSSCRIGKYPSSPIATLSLLCLHLTGFIDIVQSLYLLYNSLQVEGLRKPPSQTCLFTPLLGGVIIVYLGPPPSSFNHNFCTSMTGKSYFLASVTNTYCWCWSRNPAHHWSLASDYTNFLEGLYASWKCFF